MPRYALKIEYAGGPFAGWQKQIGQPSVQQTVEDALKRLDPDFVGIAAAGRTDTGVHALGQVAHADLSKSWEPFRLCEALNHHLKPKPVAIIAAAEVAPDWHARFSALERAYLFKLVTRRAPVTHQKGFVWQVRSGLDVEAMQAGADYLIGRHDFTTFRSSMCQAKSPVKTLDELRIERLETEGATEFHFHVRARSFLHNQVRSFVGTLERVGAGSWAPERVRDALMARNRSFCGPVCPPYGLYLRAVRYPADPFAH